MNYEKKVKNLYPDARAFAGFCGWAIVSGNVILSVSRFRTLDEAWRNAWYTASMEANKKASTE